MGWSAWLSDNPAKAWAEKFFLAYSPIWMVAVAAALLTGAFKQWGDLAYMAFGLGTMAPLLVGPLLIRDRPDRDVPWHQTYWFKFNVFVFIVVWNGSYFVSEYFFDVMGMGYGFTTTWNLDSAVVGSGAGEVPLFLYPLTQAYFVTYHTLLVVGLRRYRRALRPGFVGIAIGVFLLGYAMAFAETYVMANEILADVFWYADRARMLAFGSIGYALLFVVSLPVVYRIDEDADRPTPLGRVIVESLAVCMVAIMLLDAWAWLVGPIHH